MSEEKKDEAKVKPVVKPAVDPIAPAGKFRLKPGAKFYQRKPPSYQPELVAPGTVVELTVAQAKSFRDLFEQA